MILNITSIFRKGYYAADVRDNLKYFSKYCNFIGTNEIIVVIAMYRNNIAKYIILNHL